MNTIALADYNGPVILRVDRIKPDGTRNIALYEEHTKRGVVYVPEDNTSTIEATVFGPDLLAISTTFTFNPPPKSEYATDESLARWGTDGIYSDPQDLRRDGWDDELLTRNVTEWRKENE